MPGSLLVVAIGGHEHKLVANTELRQQCVNRTRQKPGEATGAFFNNFNVIHTYPGYGKIAYWSSTFPRPMSHRDRIRKYREHGGAADLVRVEVLVPRYGRKEVMAAAQRLRSDHRRRKEVIAPLLEAALSRYGTRVLDNVDLDRLQDIRQRARVVGRALQERADARGFILGRRLIEAAEA